MPNINLIYYLIAGSIFGALALKTGIPAAPLAGALIGASVLSISGKVGIAEWPIGTRTILEIGIGTVIGTSLTKDSLVDLQNLWKPAILITFTLVITGLAIGIWTSRLLKIDIITVVSAISNTLLNLGKITAQQAGEALVMVSKCLEGN